MQLASFGASIKARPTQPSAATAAAAPASAAKKKSSLAEEMLNGSFRPMSLVESTKRPKIAEDALHSALGFSADAKVLLQIFTRKESLAKNLAEAARDDARVRRGLAEAHMLATADRWDRPCDQKIYPLDGPEIKRAVTTARKRVIDQVAVAVKLASQRAKSASSGALAEERENKAERSALAKEQKQRQREKARAKKDAQKRARATRAERRGATEEPEQGNYVPGVGEDSDDDSGNPSSSAYMRNLLSDGIISSEFRAALTETLRQRDRHGGSDEDYEDGDETGDYGESDGDDEALLENAPLDGAAREARMREAEGRHELREQIQKAMRVGRDAFKALVINVALNDIPSKRQGVKVICRGVTTIIGPVCFGYDGRISEKNEEGDAAPVVEHGVPPHARRGRGGHEVRGSAVREVCCRDVQTPGAAEGGSAAALHGTRVHAGLERIINSCAAVSVSGPAASGLPPFSAPGTSVFGPCAIQAAIAITRRARICPLASEVTLRDARAGLLAIVDMIGVCVAPGPNFGRPALVELKTGAHHRFATAYPCDPIVRFMVGTGSDRRFVDLPDTPLLQAQVQIWAAICIAAFGYGVEGCIGYIAHVDSTSHAATIHTLEDFMYSRTASFIFYRNLVEGHLDPRMMGILGISEDKGPERKQEQYRLYRERNKKAS